MAWSVHLTHGFQPRGWLALTRNGNTSPGNAAMPLQILLSS